MARIRADLVARAAELPSPARTAKGTGPLGSVRAALADARAALAGSPGRFRNAQRLAYIAGVGALVLSMAAGTAAATRPGAPLYDARLWLEKLTLPAGGPARAD